MCFDVVINFCWIFFWFSDDKFISGVIYIKWYRKLVVYLISGK